MKRLVAAMTALTVLIAAPSLAAPRTKVTFDECVAYGDMAIDAGVRLSRELEKHTSPDMIYYEGSEKNKEVLRANCARDAARTKDEVKTSYTLMRNAQGRILKNQADFMAVSEYLYSDHEPVDDTAK